MFKTKRTLALTAATLMVGFSLPAYAGANEDGFNTYAMSAKNVAVSAPAKIMELNNDEGTKAYMKSAKTKISAIAPAAGTSTASLGYNSDLND